MKWRLWAVKPGWPGGGMAAGKRVAENENPDDAAAENSGTCEALTGPWICHAQSGSPCDKPNASLFSVTLSCKQNSDDHSSKNFNHVIQLPFALTSHVLLTVSNIRSKD